MYTDAGGRPHGIAVDVLQEAATRAGITLDWVRVTAPRNADSALRWLVDVWPSLTILDRRRPDIFFTEPWLQSEVWVVVRAQGDLPPPQFDGKVGLSTLPVTQFLAAEHLPNAQRVPYADGPALCRDMHREVPVALCRPATSPMRNRRGASVRLPRCASMPCWLDAQPWGRRRQGFEGTAERLRAEIDAIAPTAHCVPWSSDTPCMRPPKSSGSTRSCRRARGRVPRLRDRPARRRAADHPDAGRRLLRANRRARQSRAAAAAIEAKLQAAQRLDLLGNWPAGLRTTSTTW